MILESKIQEMLKTILNKEKEMAQDNENYRTNKEKQRELKKIIESMVKADEVQKINT